MTTTTHDERLYARQLEPREVEVDEDKRADDPCVEDGWGDY